MKIKDFTVIIPCISISDVRNCIRQIRKHYKNIKIIVSLNKKFKKSLRDKNIKLVFSNFKAIGKKRNLAVDNCKTKYLAFIDSDAYPAARWIESSFKLLNKKQIGVIAGPHIDPIKQNFFQTIIGLVKRSFLITMLPNHQKKISKKAGFVKFMPSANWILSKKLFNSLNQMDETMLRNEDWDFVYKMERLKKRVFYNPKMLVYHDNSTIRYFIKKRYIYGFYMWPILTKLNLQNFYFFIPLFFTFFLLSFPLVFYITNYDLFYFSILLTYLLVVFIESIRVSKNFINFIFILPVLLASNISPGFGIFFGFFNFLRNKV